MPVTPSISVMIKKRIFAPPCITNITNNISCYYSTDPSFLQVPPQRSLTEFYASGKILVIKVIKGNVSSYLLETNNPYEVPNNY